MRPLVLGPGKTPLDGVPVKTGAVPFSVADVSLPKGDEGVGVTIDPIVELPMTGSPFDGVADSLALPGPVGVAVPFDDEVRFDSGVSVGRMVPFNVGVDVGRMVPFTPSVALRPGNGRIETVSFDETEPFDVGVGRPETDVGVENMSLVVSNLVALDDGVGDPEAVEFSPIVRLADGVGKPLTLPTSVGPVLVSVALGEAVGAPETVDSPPEVAFAEIVGNPLTVPSAVGAGPDSVALANGVGEPATPELPSEVAFADGTGVPLIVPTSVEAVPDSEEFANGVGKPLTVPSSPVGVAVSVPFADGVG